MGRSAPTAAALLYFLAAALSTPAQSEPTTKVWFTEYGSPERTEASFEPEISAEKRTADTMFVGLWGAVRGPISGADANGPLNGIYCLPVMANVALHAYNEGKVLKPPPVRAPFNIHMLYADTCVEVFQKAGSEAHCSSYYGADKLMKMMLGSGFDNQKFAPLRATIGGFMFTEAVATIPSGLRIPNIGYSASAEGLNDKKFYPTYFRTNPPETAVFDVFIVFMLHFNFTRADCLVCDDAEGPKTATLRKSTALKSGITLVVFYFKHATHHGLPPEDKAAALESE